MAKNMALGSRPKTEFEKKLVGIVHVTTGKSKAKLVLQEEGKEFKSNGTDTIVVSLSDLPKRPKLAENDKVGKEYRVRMNSEGDTVEALTPVRGTFSARLIDLGPRPEKNAEPAPFERTFVKGEVENSHLEFFAVYEITAGAFKGVQLPGYYLHYKFEADPVEEGFTRFAGNFENKKATRLFQLRDWGMAHKLWDEPIPWDDDSILPTLLERALEDDREVQIVMDKGYIILVQPVESYDEPEDEESDDEDEVDKEFPKTEKKPAPTKKPVKRVSKKSADEEDDDL